MTLQLEAVAAAVAGLNIPGVRVLGLSDMVNAVSDRDLPLLGPSASEPAFLTDWDARRITMQGNQMNSYTLNWTLYQAPVGKDRHLFKQYPQMVANAVKVADAIQALPRVDGCKHIALAAMPQFGPVFDASGQQFHGATFALRVTEF